MAFGITPKYSEDVYFENYTPAQFLVLGLEAVRELGWRINFASATGFLASTNKGFLSWNAEISFIMDDEKAIVLSKSAGNEMIDFGKNKKTVAQFTEAFVNQKYALTTEDLDRRYEEMKNKLATPEQDILSLPPQTQSEKFTGFLSMFIPREGYYITPIILNLNILVWIAMVLSGANWFLPGTEVLIKWGANFRPITLEGEWWRLITNIFLHIGILHLLMNMYALVYIGILLEPRLGRTSFLTAYFLTGVAASTASLYWHSLTVSAGASGAIFGMYGIFLSMLTTNLIEKETRKALLTSIGIFVGYNLLNGVKGGIDNAAHIGGLISGMIIGYVLIPGLKKPEKSNGKYVALGTAAFIVLLSSFIAIKKIPNDIVKYQEKIQEFISMEQTALTIFRKNYGTSNESRLQDIKQKGIDNWNRSLALLNEIEKFDLPDVLHEKDKKLIAYCNLRIQSYQLMYKKYDENTDKYDDEIREDNRQIKDIIDNLKAGK